MALSIRFGLDELRRFVLTVKKNYRDVPYHNWTHAFAVAHSMYLVIRSGNDKFTALEVSDIQLTFCASRDWSAPETRVSKDGSPITAVFLRGKQILARVDGIQK